MKKVKTLKKLVKKLDNQKIISPSYDYQDVYNEGIEESIIIIKKEIKSIKKSQKNIKFDIKELEELRKKIYINLNKNFVDDRNVSDEVKYLLIILKKIIKNNV